MTRTEFTHEAGKLVAYCMDGPTNRTICLEKVKESIEWAYRMGIEAGLKEAGDRIERWAKVRRLFNHPMVKVIAGVVRNGWKK